MIHTTPFDGMTMTVDSFGTRCRYLWTSKEPEGFDPGIHLGPDAQGDRAVRDLDAAYAGFFEGAKDLGARVLYDSRTIPSLVTRTL